jgi:hypothetical protein
MQKVRFTLWMDEDVLKAAKMRASESGVTPSRVIADAARTILIDNPQNADARVLQAVERVFALIQRMDRRRGYDQQVLKEMVGLMVQSFFNHTPAIPDHDKKAALHSGKARFNRFLDTLATNLRSGQSITNDIPAAPEAAADTENTGPPQPTSAAESNRNLPSRSHTDEPTGPFIRKTNPPEAAKTAEPPSETTTSDSKNSRWNLFGVKES